MQNPCGALNNGSGHGSPSPVMQVCPTGRGASQCQILAMVCVGVGAVVYNAIDCSRGVAKKMIFVRLEINAWASCSRQGSGRLAASLICGQNPNSRLVENGVGMVYLVQATILRRRHDTNIAD